ncbi:hypothetical protein [Prochlorococcus sp. MIT 1307]|uniref:hypothetical protein n=1 Tax=Prochlorococcus sp. MIT 1307 TaxID=3096219 RepID=UPI002A74E333|nr:hypothetical protein [Prochlorococcus sp. MIT 1307]
MHNSLPNLLVEIAKAADICNKPFKHSVLEHNFDSDNKKNQDSLDDLILKIESRNLDGVRYPEHDLELEIYKSGNDLHVMLAWFEQPQRPILWQGKHSMWMDAGNGKRCQAPLDGQYLESLARRLRTLFIVNNSKNDLA